MHSDYYYSHFSYLPPASVYLHSNSPIFHIYAFLFCDLLGFTRDILVTTGVELSIEAWWA